MNPMAIFALKSSFDKFKDNHPKFIQFAQTMMQIGIQEGTVLECKVITPEGKELQANIKITPNDLELLEKIKEVSRNNQ